MEIKIDLLSEKSIKRAERELKAYKNELHNQLVRLRWAIANELQAELNAAFASCYVDDIVSPGEYHLKGDVPIRIDVRDNQLVVVCGGDAVWIEFGTGVHFNGAVGTSLHPQGSLLPAAIGQYGHGHGKHDTWHFKESSGKRLATHGVPAQMPIYQTVNSIHDRIIELAKGIFA